MVRALATMLAANRVLFGVGYLFAPERVGAGWIGRAARKDATKVFTRALGARDLALGVGALGALARRDESARTWFAAHALSDAVDLGATIAARNALPDSGFRLGVGMAGASTAIALAGALALNRG